MTWERSQQVEEIFQTALNLPAAKRASYLSEACADDLSLRDEVANLLASQETEDYDFEGLIPPEAQFNAHESFDDDRDPLIGRRVGAYRIEREIGRGGMGTVYEAVRADKEFSKRVAIKLVKRGMDTDFILRRFRKERQILASLDHPNIGLLLDGGTTEDGLPYFVMEFIEGQTLYRYCDEHQLNIAERLRVFLSICDAVHYAHQKQVVHRDIKPSNVFVTSAGAVKLLDFGIAKLLNPALVGDITHDPTATAMLMMTPEYAAPEQVQGAPIRPTTDVYSLGVLLYELLTGHRPYHIGNRAPHEIARVICEELPAPLSIIITRPSDLLPQGNARTTLEHVYSARGAASVEVLRRDLSGELETIVMRALRKEPEWRYQSARQLRDDIVCYLEGRPLSSLPDPPVSAARLRPSPAVLETALAVLPLKVIDLPGADSSFDYLGTGLADALITRLSAIQRFAVRPTSSVLRYRTDGDPLAAGRELGVAFVLEGRIRHAGDRIRVTVQLLDVQDGTAAWAGQFDERFTDVLSLEDAISTNVAEAIVPHLTGDELTRLAKRGTNDPQAHEAYLRGRSYWNKFNEEGFAKAIVCYHQAIAIDPDYAIAHAAVAEYYNWLGIYSVLPANECAIAAYQAAATAVAIDPMLPEAHCALGQAKLCRDFAWESAERQLFRAIELNPNYAPARTWYAFQLAMEGRFTEAAREAHAAVSLDPFSIISRFCQVWSLYQAREFEAALELCRERLRSDPKNLMLLYMSSFMLSALGQHQEAIATAEQCVALIGKASRTLGRLGSAYAEGGKIEQAEAVLREMEEVAARRYISPYHVALVQCALGRAEAALDLLERAVDLKDAWVLGIAVDPELDPLRGHPRFDALLRKINHRLAALPTLSIEAPPDQESIAVLPFKVLTAPTGSTGDQYLGLGLADALITRLSNVRRLIVRPTSSVLRYRDEMVDPIVAGRELKVDYVLDGSLRRVGERLRVTTQLMRVAEGVSSWAEHFDERSTDVLQIEDSISERVTSVLLPQLTGDERNQLSKRGTGNSEAFESYLRGRYYWNTYTESGLARAIECYNHAIKLDPKYALAYTGIADYYNWLGVFGFKPFKECSEAAYRTAQKAIELDPAAAEAYSALGFATATRDFGWAEAESYHRRAIEINPNYATGHHWYGFHLQMVGRFDEAVAEMLRARELDPLAPGVLQGLGWCYYQARRFEQSIATYESMLEAVPEFSYGLATYAWALRGVDRADEAVAASEKALQHSSGGQIFVAGLGASYAAAGRTADARATLARLNEMSARSYVSPYHRALIHLHLGERDEALALLKEAYEINEGWLVWLGVEPHWDSLRGDPIFEDLLSKTRNPAPQSFVEGLPAVPRERARAAAAVSAPVTSASPAHAADTSPGLDDEAQQLFIAGRYYATRRTAEGLRQAIQRLERAVELKPDYGAAWAELADCYALLNWFVEPAPPDAWQHAKEAALSAVKADPSLAEAHASLGFVRLHFDRDWEDAEVELQKAIVLNPSNQVAHRWFAYSLSAMGRHHEAVSEIERARELSPQSPVIATAVANVLFLAGRFDDAIAQCRKALALDPGGVAAHTILRWAYERKGMVSEALAAYEQERIFAGDTPTTRAKRAHVLAATGNHEEARKILEEIIRLRDEQWVTAYEIAIVYALLGDRDNAFLWLGHAKAEHAVGYTFARVDPHLESLRSDPRSAQLLSRKPTASS
jgi:eukaryotic-like serine/threonine-protein kinase